VGGFQGDNGGILAVVYCVVILMVRALRAGGTPHSHAVSPLPANAQFLGAARSAAHQDDNPRISALKL